MAHGRFPSRGLRGQALSRQSPGSWQQPLSCSVTTGSHPWGHRRFCVPPHCNSAPDQETDPRISSSFRLEPFVTEQWLTVALRGPPRQLLSQWDFLPCGLSQLSLPLLVSNRCLWPWRAFQKTSGNQTWGPFRENCSEGSSGVS